MVSGLAVHFIPPFSMNTLFWTCILVLFLLPHAFAQDLTQLRKIIVDNLPATLPDDLGRKVPSQELINACQTLVDAANQIYTLPNLDEQNRDWTLRREALARILLAYVDTPTHYSRLAAISDELEKIGPKDLAIVTEEHVLKIGSVLATQTGNNAMNINVQALAERMVLFAEQHPDSKALQIIELFLQQVRTSLKAAQRDRRLAVIAPIFQEFFRKIHYTSRALALEPDVRRATLPGNPMVLIGVDLDGKDFDPAVLENKVVLLQFWGTWCGPCMAEIPDLMTLYEKYRDSGFEIIGINTAVQGDNENKVKQFVDTKLFGNKKIPWKILHEGLSERKNGQSITKFYGIDELPVLILIGRDGKVRDLHPLPSTLDELIAKATSPLASIEFTEEERKILEENERKRQAEIDRQIKRELSAPQ